MRYIQQVANRIMIATQSVATNATVTGLVDCKGFNGLRVKFLLGVAGATATTGVPTTMKLQQSDDTSTGWEDITGYTSLAPTTWPTAATSISQAAAICDVDLGVNRKRYIRAVVTSGGTAQVVTVIADLTKPDVAPTTAAGIGAATWVQPLAS